jgi:hypothetical protein
MSDRASLGNFRFTTPEIVSRRSVVAETLPEEVLIPVPIHLPLCYFNEYITK